MDKNEREVLSAFADALKADAPTTAAPEAATAYESIEIEIEPDSQANRTIRFMGRLVHEGDSKSIYFTEAKTVVEVLFDNPRGCITDYVTYETADAFLAELAEAARRGEPVDHDLGADVADAAGVTYYIDIQ